LRRLGGHYELEGVAPGVYDIYASAAGYPEVKIASNIRILKGQSYHADGYVIPGVQIIATPIIGITLALIIVERVFGIGVFDPAKGGDPVLYQHLFWIYSHPATYIMILPAMGVVSDVIPVFARKKIFGYMAIAISGVAIAGVGSFVWGHHMFVSGQSDFANLLFSLLTFLVAVPSAIKVFNWIATLHKGSIVLEPPLLFCLGFIFLFSIGGLTGLFSKLAPGP
jgi:cytochrome c oxidase subunit 1